MLRRLRLYPVNPEKILYILSNIRIEKVYEK